MRIGNRLRRQIAVRQRRGVVGHWQSQWHRPIACGSYAGADGLNFRPPGFFGHAGRVIVLAQHLHVAAQRQNADAVFRFTPLKLAELQAVNIEAEIELFAFHAARFGDEKMPQFVHENHEAQAAADLKMTGQ